MLELGNRKLKSYKTTYIRRVIVDDAQVSVHRDIVPQTEELLIRAVDNGVTFSTDGLPVTLNGYDPEGSDPYSYGLVVEIPTSKDLSDIGIGLGFEGKHEGDVTIFTFDPEAEPAPVPTFEDIRSEQIGSRQVKIGASGKDVKFINLYINNEDDEDRFTQKTQEGVLYLQERLGIPQSGMFDWYTWHSVLPRRNYRLVPGSAGPKVRALQSALRCNAYNPPLTSRYGTETIHAVREFQVDNDLRVTGKIGLQEWSLLFDYH